MKYQAFCSELLLQFHLWGLKVTDSHVIIGPDVYLLGTVMLVFGMGLYELFVSNLDIAKSLSEAKHRSNLFGLFPLTVIFIFPVLDGLI